MTEIQATQIQTIEPRSELIGDPSSGGAGEASFQKYLDEEQKKRGNVFFSGTGQFNFFSWFSYPNFSAQLESSRSPIFSDNKTDEAGKTTPTAKQENQTYNFSQSSAPKDSSNVSRFTSGQSVKATIQELLSQTGWLVPNLEAFPLFSLAEQKGTLLNKLDLQFLVDQIVSRLKLVKDKGSTTLTLGLKPEDLGEIILTLTSRGGMISIKIEAKEETRKMLDASLDALKNSLKDKIDLGEIKVTAIKEAGNDV